MSKKNTIFTKNHSPPDEKQILQIKLLHRFTNVCMYKNIRDSDRLFLQLLL